MARHRIASATGLGNPEKAFLDNRGRIDRRFADAALEAYFGEHGGFDFRIAPDSVSVGVEPSYQYDPLLIVTISRLKDQSCLVRGQALGAYGSEVRKTVREYGDYVQRCKFVRFVDEWHPVLFPVSR